MSERCNMSHAVVLVLRGQDKPLQVRGLFDVEVPAGSNRPIYIEPGDDLRIAFDGNTLTITQSQPAGGSSDD